MVKKILIANRGEIAVRIIRSCHEMGIKTVALFSDADRMSKHVMLADQAYNIGPAPSSESYLAIDKIVEAALASGADAIHPGYGFLSENAGFARRCGEAGLTFIGPRPETIERMGDKISARAAMIEAGVPVVPGIERDLASAEEAVEVCRQVGFPAILKAASGGGGKGMRLVRSEDEVAEAFASARSEALSSFGDQTVYIEKFIEEPHHIEFQVLGDTHGNIVHLFDRECSVQRRHQKIVEESPSPFLTPRLRREMGEAAVAAAKAVGYVGAGTIEFLVDNRYNFYFLEMNTRLQVEHPVTEQVLDIDLVKEQINVASGLPLRFEQGDIKQRGHSIECRICAEDADNNFMPSPGLIKQVSEPNGLGLRIDSYIYEGYEIPIYYDPMIAKLIVHATDREYALERMRRALDEFKISGIKTNIAYLNAVINTPAFAEGRYDTAFLEKNEESIRRALTENSPGSVDEKLVEDMILIATKVSYLMTLEGSLGPVNPPPTATLNRWREFGKRKGLMRF